VSEGSNLVKPLYEILRDFPSDGQLRKLDQDTIATLLIAGFIERREVEKPCRTCGKPQFDYAYFRITGGGRLFMAAVENATPNNDLPTGNDGGRSS
jgi:hypothetical protein